jgi:GxxExxY protein
LALCRELWLRSIGVERQVSVPVHYKGTPIDCSVQLDLLVQRSIIVEVKSVEKIIPVHRAQLLTYLRLRELWLGLIINFNVEVLRDGVRRPERLSVLRDLRVLRAFVVENHRSLVA